MPARWLLVNRSQQFAWMALPKALFAWMAICFTTSLQAQPDPSDLLQRVRARVADTLDRLPRYMCAQTINRTIAEPAPNIRGNFCDHPPATHLTVADRLRLDVAVTSEGEIYSWVGARRFSDRELSDLVRDGAISNGSFAGWLSAIFHSNGATFTPHGPHGHNLVEFGFQVPYEKSTYKVGNREHQNITGYGGTFLVDTKTGDLMQLVVRSDREPPDSDQCYSTNTLSYGRVHLQGDDFLLPIHSQLVIFSRDGSRSENRTVFSGCHEFLGETSVKFDPPAEDAPRAASTDSPSIAIPPGLSFSVVLTQEIRTATAAVGDIVEGKLLAPIGDATKVLVPEGAKVTARVVRLRQFFGRRPVVSLAISLRTVEVGGVSMSLTAQPDTGKIVTKKGKEYWPSVDLGPLGAWRIAR